MFEYLVIIAAVSSLLAAFVYIRSMFIGNTKPNRVSWLMWAIAPLITTAAALSNGVGWAVLPVFMAGFRPFLFLPHLFPQRRLSGDYHLSTICVEHFRRLRLSCGG